MKKFEVYINVEDVNSCRVEAENEEAVDELLQELFDEYGIDFYSFLEDRRVNKARVDTMTDYQIDIMEIIPADQADQIIMENKVRNQLASNHPSKTTQFGNINLHRSSVRSNLLINTIRKHHYLLLAISPSIKNSFIISFHRDYYGVVLSIKVQAEPHVELKKRSSNNFL